MNKLNEEIDILEIVKKLRVASFASEVALKPRQRRLIGFFDDFKLKTPDEKNTETNWAHKSAKIERRETIKGIGESFGDMEE